MRTIATVAATMAFLFTQASSVLAVDLVNEDDVDYTVIIEEGGKDTVIEIGADEAIEGVCDECAVRFPGEDGFKSFETDVITIRNGVMYIAS